MGKKHQLLLTMYDVITDDYLVADETLILHRRPSEQKIRIPGEIAPGHRITRIGNAAFSCDKNLRSIEIPDGVTHVGFDNFLSRDTLAEIYIPTSVTQWKDRFFLFG